MANEKRGSFLGSGESKSPAPLAVPSGIGRRQKLASFEARLRLPVRRQCLQVARAAVERPDRFATNRRRRRE